ncbi:leukocyte receptor cluster member 9 [Microcaecilia unicolor]|uniref:Leukocyte receptor cluster member 9 n=1 Tax=Microcaecilia unicolor TaxID=1415580 RepID=A0A6P7XML3_9AMPH|nr:leukocyte receptor cluster member 9 [Microcaecilia unicolor]XP_030053768.1 leukocyte receptor cluster member 9 [Microcaecilia unicolor]
MENSSEQEGSGSLEDGMEPGSEKEPTGERSSQQEKSSSLVEDGKEQRAEKEPPGETSSEQEGSGSLEDGKESGTEEPTGGTDNIRTCSFFMEGRCRFGNRCRSLHPGSKQENAVPFPPKSTKEGATVALKKPPMKTAEDVISRIQWDEHLPKESFVVGYLDRFLGTLEKPFSAFSWEDLASVGHDVLAIPKHRIQYFKFRDLIVWDKRTRTDNVFGSTGSGQTILDIVGSYETLVQLENHEDTAEDAIESENNNDCAPGESTAGDSHKHPSTQRLRPTHFVAIRISSTEIQDAIKEVQQYLLKERPQLAEFCCSVSTLHLTLCPLHLDCPEEIEKALTVLQEVMSTTQRLLPPMLILHFQGLEDFHSRVLYIAPSETTELLTFMRVLNHSFREKGLVVIQPPNSQKLHLTVAKVPINRSQKDPMLQLCPDLYREWQGKEFGSQAVDSLCFCYAGKDRRSDGFYTTLLELPLY